MNRSHLIRSHHYGRLVRTILLKDCHLRSKGLCCRRNRYLSHYSLYTLSTALSLLHLIPLSSSGTSDTSYNVHHIQFPAHPTPTILGARISRIYEPTYFQGSVRKLLLAVTQKVHSQTNGHTYISAVGEATRQLERRELCRRIDANIVRTEAIHARISTMSILYDLVDT